MCIVTIMAVNSNIGCNSLYTVAIHTMRAKHLSRRHYLILIIAAVLVGGVIFLLIRNDKDTTTNPSNPVESIAQNILPTNKKGTLKSFTGDQFKDLYSSFTYPNTQKINESTPILGDDAADAKIRQIAVSRGYQVRSAPVTNAFQDVGDGFLLQRPAAQPWLDLVASAKKENINLGLTAAYRSAEDQKQIFTSRLAQQSVPTPEIANGAHDAKISQVLRTTAIPGFSRHHTGYTIDISCEDKPDSSFMYTPCFEWLSANNYENAKKHGWIPSYPEGTASQGPDPESWEYVWVGVDALTE